MRTEADADRVDVEDIDVGLPVVDDPDADVPSSEDLKSLAGAVAWVEAADRERPFREALRSAIAKSVGAQFPGARAVLELGSGPGQLAECVLHDCPWIRSYVLFDFSAPMLAMARERLRGRPAVSFVLGDFRAAGWSASVGGPFDAVVSMQAVHELRHKRRAPELYRQLFDLVVPGGSILICDHLPIDDSARARALYMTEAEQLDALAGAGFRQVRVALSIEKTALYEGARPARRP